jgi:hypothetical protein
MEPAGRQTSYAIAAGRSLGKLDHLQELNLPQVGVPGIEVAKLKKATPKTKIRVGNDFVD